MKTKSFTIFGLFLLFSLCVYSQNTLYTFVVGDSAILSLTGANGAAIQWQQSTDSLIWSDIPSATAYLYPIITTTSPTGKRYFRANVIRNSHCGDVKSSIIRHKIISNSTQVQIGDWFCGGIVFYTDGTGYGLIAPQQDQSSGVQWGCYGTSIPGAVSLTDGAANTAAIVVACVTRPIAASICDSLTINGYNDWCLPAKDQLNYLYQQRSLVGGFSTNLYWSSSEFSADYAWIQNLYNGYQYNDFSKYTSYYVRCVRSYEPIGNINKPLCNATVSIPSVFQNQKICIVSVNDVNKNLIVWDKPGSTAIDSFYIYKETNITNIYDKIGGIAYDSLSLFIDYNSYPDIQSNKYKISVVDTCGIESSLSPSHKTMHLAINQGVPPTWNLIWDPYDGFIVSTYNVYRGTDANNLQLIGTSSGSNTQYSDFSAPSGYVYYQVEVVSPNMCNPSKSINTSRSNKATNKPQGVNKILNNNFINVYPNPAKNEIIIEILQNIKPTGMTCDIINTDGQILRNIVLKEKKNRIDIKELNSGLYTIKVKSENGITIKKMIKE